MFVVPTITVKGSWIRVTEHRLNPNPNPLHFSAHRLYI